jgi:hypothetical protein
MHRPDGPKEAGEVGETEAGEEEGGEETETGD